MNITIRCGIAQEIPLLFCAMKIAKDLKIPFAWPDRHPIFLDRFLYLPGHYDHKEEVFGFFEKAQPTMIEYCSGNGQWVGERARQNPHLNWIAVEKKFERARKIWLKIHREGLSNLCVVCGEALIFTRYYAPPIEEVYVNFPDPWPKLRHAKHRLVRADFLNELEKAVVPRGKVTCVTDHEDYAAEMRREFLKCPGWQFLFHVNEWPEYGHSFFNHLWVKKGKTIHYLSYEKKE